MFTTQKLALFFIVISMFPVACSTTTRGSIQSDQEHLGQGIVIGSIAEQQKHQAVFASWPLSLTVKGQVTKIEGAAYVVVTEHGRGMRIPIDQETTIDRPAHVGDWIQAYTDNSGRALQIRNIDEEIVEVEG